MVRIRVCRRERHRKLQHFYSIGPWRFGRGRSGLYHRVLMPGELLRQCGPRVRGVDGRLSRVPWRRELSLDRMGLRRNADTSLPGGLCGHQNGMRGRLLRQQAFLYLSCTATIVTAAGQIKVARSVTRLSIPAACEYGFSSSLA